MATIFFYFGEFSASDDDDGWPTLQKYRLHFYRAIAKLHKMDFTCAPPPESQPNCYLQLPVSISAVRDFIILRIPAWFTFRMIYLLLSTQSTLCRPSKMYTLWAVASCALESLTQLGNRLPRLFHRTKRKVINFQLVPATESIPSSLGFGTDLSWVSHCNLRALIAGWKSLINVLMVEIKFHYVMALAGRRVVGRRMRINLIILLPIGFRTSDQWLRK